MHQILTPGSVRQPVRVPVRRSLETGLLNLPTTELENAAALAPAPARRAPGRHTRQPPDTALFAPHRALGPGSAEAPK
jgi:hypothetical protein